MNKKVSLFLALAGLMLGACSSSDDVNGGGAGTGENKTSYIAVNINNVGSVGSRAGDIYDNGTEAEAKINKIRFYFFNTDGTPYYVDQNQEFDSNGETNSNANWVEVTPTESSITHPGGNVETQTGAMLVLNGKLTTKPAKIIAIINPDMLKNSENQNGNRALRLSQLTQMQGDEFYNSDNGFVMTNSVYMVSGQKVCETSVTNNVASSKEAALNNPVDIYVERVNAKVTASVDESYQKDGATAWTKNSDGKWQIKVGEFDRPTVWNVSGEATQYETTPIYAVVEGWGLADEDGKAEYCKQISTNWTSPVLGIKDWNNPTDHRCYWSLSVPFAGENQPVNHTFNNYKTAIGSSLYTLPNTTPDANATTAPTDVYNSNLTKLLVAAKLVWYDGGQEQPAEICEYNGIDHWSIKSVQTAIVNAFGSYYKYDEAASKYVKLEPSDITFGTSDDVNVKDYQVVPKLAADITELYRSNSDDGQNLQKVSDAEFNNVKNNISKEPVAIRKTGCTYYYAPVQHLGSSGSVGQYGIVRNHTYKVTIQDISGFGTPVYDPDEKIIDPTIPSNDHSYLSARVNVLSWRVVGSLIQLDQTKK